MVNDYSIKILNHSGDDHQYVIFSQPPIVTGSVQSKIWSNVIDSAQTPAGQNATFSIEKQFFATCGNSHGQLKDGLQVNVKVKGNAPLFDNNTYPNTSFPNSFEIDTAADFSKQDATNNNFIIGLGSGPSDTEVAPIAVFTPQPNVKYQIQPVNTYYISYGEYTPGDLIDVTMLGQTVAVDFAHHSPNVVINHTERGSLVVMI